MSFENKHDMNFIPNKHELKRVIFIQQREFPEGKEREKKKFRIHFNIFISINVKYK